MVAALPPSSARMVGEAMLVTMASSRSITSAARMTKRAAQRHRYGAVSGGDPFRGVSVVVMRAPQDRASSTLVRTVFS